MSDVAKIILEQLGGSRFIAMTGAKSLMGGENSLSMQLPRNKSGANRFKIVLEPDDTYTVMFGRYRNLEVKPIALHIGVYAEDLQRIFTSVTGMATRL